MQYQTKCMMKKLKLFVSRQSSLRRTLLVAGLLIGCVGVAFVSLQQSLQNAQARSATPQRFSQARSVSLTVSSHRDHQTVTYTLTVHTGVHGATIRPGIPITFTDSIPAGLSQIRAKGSHWNTKVSSKVGPSLVTGTYKGSYPIGPGATLPAVIIEGTINHYASNVLTNSASVSVPGNTDLAHSKAVVSDNIKPALSSLSLPNSNNKNSICSNSCSLNHNNTCAKICNQQVSDACTSQCDSSQSSSDACTSQCDSSQSSSDACTNQCDSPQSTSNACTNQCAQIDTHTSVREQVHISVYENSCECSQQNTDKSGADTPSNVTSNRKIDPNGNRPTTPFPALPNTGSDPNYL